MDYPVIDIEGTGTNIRELIRESGHTVVEVSEYLGTSTSLVDGHSTITLAYYLIILYASDLSGRFRFDLGRK